MALDLREQPIGRSPAFATTHWSLVVAAGNRDSPHAEKALAELCQIYWYPLYAYVRRRGYGPEDAEDLTQDFFVRLMEKEYLGLADRQRGKFRTFLLCAMKHFLINHQESSKAVVRGGRVNHLSIDAQDAERQYLAEPVEKISPERYYEKRWAMTVLDQALRALECEYARAESLELFLQLKACLGGHAHTSYAEIGHRLGMSEGSVKTAAFRMRQRFGQALHAEVAKTIDSPDEVEDELRSLMALFE